MLNNRKTFEEKLIPSLRAIDPDVPLPERLPVFLWEKMEPDPFCKNVTELEKEGEIPANAYFVVKGFVLVCGYNSKLDRYIMRIYGENKIVAMNCFMRQKKSKYTIIGCKGTLVWRISSAHMQEIYKEMEGMLHMAWKTAGYYNDDMEEMKNDLLSHPMQERVLRFYSCFVGLLPSKKSPIRDAAIADYLQMSVAWLKRIRKKLSDDGLL